MVSMLENKFEEERAYRRGFNQGWFLAIEHKNPKSLIRKIMDWRYSLREKTRIYKCPPGSPGAGVGLFSKKK